MHVEVIASYISESEAKDLCNVSALLNFLFLLDSNRARVHHYIGDLAPVPAHMWYVSLRPFFSQSWETHVGDSSEVIVAWLADVGQTRQQFRLNQQYYMWKQRQQPNWGEQ